MKILSARRMATVAAASSVALFLGTDVLADKDLIVGRIAGSSGSDVADYGTVDGISAYAIGTTSCNNGTELLSWRDSGTFADQHPVIAQNLYRLKDGRFEQIGISWLKHGFCAADSTVCGSCQSASGCDWLGLGCSDTYGSGLNGGFSSLGPRHEVNPVTGEFTWPHSSPNSNATLRGRLQVKIGDVDPSQNSGALYFAESQYITPDDAGTAFANNNHSWRDASVGSFSGGIWNVFCSGVTQQQDPAILAWKANDPSATIVTHDVEGDGRFMLGYSCTDNGDGTWHYEYALLNMNSHRSGQSFTVPCPEGVTMTSPGFHSEFYHSGEPYSNAAWHSAETEIGMEWTTPTFAKNPNSNALRWGTLYNFRFDADSPPQAADIEVGMFLPGTPTSFTMPACGPSPLACSGNADINDDGVVDVQDMTELILNWGPCDACPSDIDCSGEVDVSDLTQLILDWG